MRWFHGLLIGCVLVLTTVGIIYFHQDRAILLKEPPASLAQWYKPENKRHVWLHTMFKLRRERLAIAIYAQQQDAAKLQKWVEKFSQDYEKMATMVPEWANKLDRDALRALQQRSQQQLFKTIPALLTELDDSCDSCHRDYRAVVANRYRAPDFSAITLADGAPLPPHMTMLSEQVNRIKIGFVDGDDAAALEALQHLNQGMVVLGDTCIQCHKTETPAYPSDAIQQASSQLETALQGGDIRAKGKALGSLAVMACAQCHGTHRVAGDMRQLLTKGHNWHSLLKH